MEGHVHPPFRILLSSRPFPFSFSFFSFFENYVGERPFTRNIFNEDTVVTVLSVSPYAKIRFYANLRLFEIREIIIIIKEKEKWWIFLKSFPREISHIYLSVHYFLLFLQRSIDQTEKNGRCNVVSFIPLMIFIES